MLILTPAASRSPLVDSDWLARRRDDPHIQVLIVGQPPELTPHDDEVLLSTLPGAKMVNLKMDFAEPDGKYPNTFPTKHTFEQTCRSLGIVRDSVVVLIDRKGIYYSPRLWYIFRKMGHEHVYVLDGGADKWGQSIVSGETSVKAFQSAQPLIKESQYVAEISDDAFCTIEHVRSVKDAGKALIIDARSAGRFSGTLPEPRLGVASGHIENSINIPFAQMLNEGRYKSIDEIKTVFDDMIGEDARPLIFMCGSGVTACIPLLAAHIIRTNKVAVYDGSWTEWACENS